MQLEEIIRFDANYMRDVTVNIDSAFGTVEILDDTKVQEPIFLQGSDAELFLRQYRELSDKSPNSLFSDIAAHLAVPYVDSLWN